MKELKKEAFKKAKEFFLWSQSIFSWASPRTMAEMKKKSERGIFPDAPRKQRGSDGDFCWSPRQYMSFRAQQLAFVQKGEDDDF